MTDKLTEFRSFREKMNEKILDEGDLNLKRFFNLDSRIYEEGALSSSVKELLGLVASMVLKCDDCISYHIIRCKEEGVSKEELYEAFNVALIVGGSIVIPHLRRAVALLDELEEDKGTDEIWEIYTDGSCSGNPGPGGYAALLLHDDKEIPVTGYVPETTNNRMELKAVIEALKEVPVPKKIKLYSDSSYVLNGLSDWLENWKKKGWKTSSNKPVSNQDLWQELDILIDSREIEYIKVEGHSGDHYNEQVDTLAREEIISHLEGE